MRLSRDLVSDPGRFNLASFRELVAFSFFLDLSNRAMERYLESGGAIHAARRRRGARVPPRCLSPPLYETRKLVKRVIMSNGRAAGSREDPFLLLLFLASSRSRVPFLSFSSSSSPSLFGSPPTRGPHAENRAISFTLRQHANSRIV